MPNVLRENHLKGLRQYRQRQWPDLPSRNSSDRSALMLLLRIIGALADFVVESFLWTCFLLSLPLICVGFFVYEIFWNTKVFMFYLTLVPGLLVDMWYDVPVGRFFLCVLIVILVKWAVTFVCLRIWRHIA